MHTGRMHSRQSGFSLVETMGLITLLVILVAIGFLVFHKGQNKSLSAQQIAMKFDCSRVTADIRQTDVFCNNPKFYNDPDSVTAADYYMYYGCAVRLKNAPPAESAKTDDPGYYDAYYNCKDRAKLENMRLDFIKQLKKIKNENN